MLALTVGGRMGCVGFEAATGGRAMGIEASLKFTLRLCLRAHLTMPFLGLIAN